MKKVISILTLIITMFLITTTVYATTDCACTDDCPAIMPISLLNVTDNGSRTLESNVGTWRKVLNQQELPGFNSTTGKSPYTDAIKADYNGFDRWTNTILTLSTKYDTISFTAYNQSEFTAEIRITNKATNAVLWTTTLDSGTSKMYSDIDISNSTRLEFGVRLPDATVSKWHNYDTVYITNPTVQGGTCKNSDGLCVCQNGFREELGLGQPQQIDNCDCVICLSKFSMSFLSFTNDGRNTTDGHTGRWQRTAENTLITSSLYMDQYTRAVYRINHRYNHLSFNVTNSIDYSTRVQVLDYRTKVVLWSAILTPGQSMQVNDINIMLTRDIEFVANALQTPGSIGHQNDAITISNLMLKNGLCEASDTYCVCSNVHEVFRFDVTIPDGGATFYMPLNGFIAFQGLGDVHYNWVIDWGDGTPETENTGTVSQINDNSLYHKYENAGVYEITIKPKGLMCGWLRAFGTGGTATSRHMITKVNSPLTPKMAICVSNLDSGGGTGCFSENVFLGMFWGATNITMGEDFTFSSEWNKITTVGWSFGRYMFRGVANDNFTMNEIFNLPQSITTVGHTFAAGMFEDVQSKNFTMNSIFNLPQNITSAGSHFGQTMFRNLKSDTFNMNAVFNMPPKMENAIGAFGIAMFHGVESPVFTMNSVFNLPQNITTISDSYVSFMFQNIKSEAFKVNDVFTFPKVSQDSINSHNAFFRTFYGLAEDSQTRTATSIINGNPTPNMKRATFGKAFADIYEIHPNWGGLVLDCECGDCENCEECSPCKNDECQNCYPCDCSDCINCQHCYPCENEECQNCYPCECNNCENCPHCSPCDNDECQNCYRCECNDCENCQHCSPCENDECQNCYRCDCGDCENCPDCKPCDDSDCQNCYSCGCICTDCEEEHICQPCTDACNDCECETTVTCDCDPTPPIIVNPPPLVVNPPNVIVNPPPATPPQVIIQQPSTNDKGIQPGSSTNNTKSSTTQTQTQTPKPVEKEEEQEQQSILQAIRLRVRLLMPAFLRKAQPVTEPGTEVNIIDVESEPEVITQEEPEQPEENEPEILHKPEEESVTANTIIDSIKPYIPFILLLMLILILIATAVFIFLRFKKGKATEDYPLNYLIKRKDM